MGSLLLFLRFLNYTVFNRSGICKRFVELYNKVVSEILRYTAAVTGGISDDPVLFRYNPDIGTTVESIYHDIGMFISGNVKRNSTARSVGVNSVTTSCSARYTL